jgi:hypothetical protein
MIDIKLNGNHYEVKKGAYTNGRLKLLLVNSNELIDLSRNIDGAIFLNDCIGETSGRELFVNHIDGWNYECLLDELECSNLFEFDRWNQLSIQGNVKNNFNTYIGVEIKRKEAIKEMEVI